MLEERTPKAKTHPAQHHPEDHVLHALCDTKPVQTQVEAGAGVASHPRKSGPDGGPLQTVLRCFQPTAVQCGPHPVQNEEAKPLETSGGFWNRIEQTASKVPFQGSCLRVRVLGFRFPPEKSLMGERTHILLLGKACLAPTRSASPKCSSIDRPSPFLINL